MESSKPDPNAAQVEPIIDNAALASSVVIDQTEIDLQSRMMEGSRSGRIYESSDENLSKNIGVEDSENDHIAPASELSSPPIDVTTVDIEGTHGVSDGQKPQQAVVDGDNDIILPSASSNNSADGSIKDTLDGKQSQGNGSLGSSPKVNDSDVEDAKKGDHLVQIRNLVLPRKRIITSSFESPKSGTSTPTKEGDLNKVHIDTAATFESVKEAGSKFGGIVRWKSNRTQTVERRKLAVQDLEKLQEDMVVYKNRLVDAEEEKMQVLQELDRTNRQINELKLSLEKAQNEENQARQDSELAMLRAEEMEQGIGDEASIAAKQQLEVAKARHAAAFAELESVNEELETLRKGYASMVTERDIAIKEAEEAKSSSKEVERTVEGMTIDMMATKESLESAQAIHVGAEEKRIVAAMARDQDTHYWEKELKQAEEELQRLNQQIQSAKDMKPKLDTASALLLDLKAELDAYMESKSKLENNGYLSDASLTPEKRTHTDIPAAVASAKKELEEVKLKIEKATTELDSLKVVAVSLESELEKEKSALASMKQIESMKEKEARDKMVEATKLLQQVAQEADEAKSVVEMANQELSKLKEEAEQAKARAGTLESRLLAVEKEIEAAKASKESALVAIETLQDTNNVDSSDSVILSLEEYYDLRKRAYEVEEQASMIAAAAVSQIEEAKQSHSRSLVKLEEVNREMAERKEALEIALEKAEKAKEGKLGVEQELRQWRAKHEKRRKASGSSHGGNPPRSSFEGKRQSNKVEPVTMSPSSTLDTSKATYGHNKENESSPETVVVKKKKKSLFPKIFMFFSRKKASFSKTKSKTKSKT
ncbi:protein WEAK CHLOROPLAST MOVEMENT UNDER BLUE LIGHT 1-like [Gossypium australe]|uniref:Protein WEAK CHLOROPLAST MOVEMENT UNDER BLUE LIGHT 1-like n=1 Tax=Gossypium australe TaxID=47621 RepID=A0A5B6VDA5_9ROSI|nr:protein WEAK CHLOROPLAST MOVEMENT UNDER BLUE LIGHT 1-like [Gossypium australe]